MLSRLRHSLQTQLNNWLHQRTTLLLSLLFCIGMSLVLWNMHRLSERLVMTHAQHTIENYAQAVTQARTIYSGIVDNAQLVEGIYVTETMMAEPSQMAAGEIPLPITFLRDLSERVKADQGGVWLRLYSDLPFQHHAQTGGVKTEFEQQALDYLRQYPDRTFTQVLTTPQGREYHYAQADVMKPSCIDCHNRHPDSPKRDWQVGDVRGVLHLAQPLNTVTAEVSRGLRETFVVLGGLGVLAIVGITLVMDRLRRISHELEVRVAQRTAQLQDSQQELIQEQKKSEQLLLNVLPPMIAEELKEGQSNIAQDFTQVTVLFADLVGFTSFSAQVTPIALVEILNQIFSEFDHLAEHYGLEKIKTIGDAYMVVGGLPVANANHAGAIAEMALSMQAVIDHFQRPDGEPFEIRIGINTGPVVAGVIGLKKFSYDLWGDTVNIAARMESLGEPGEIQVTAATYEFLKTEYKLTERGAVQVKGKGEMITYWLMGKK
ncbi:MAG: adenylate/guanylate cyclase domain-containing protein [Cyanobacteria bacterium P01_G01_bin.54]